MQHYRNREMEAYGVDGLNGAGNRSGGLVKQVDLTKQTWCRHFGLVVCMEVLEHIPPWHEDAVVEQLKCSAQRRIVLSWAGPRQKGNGHVNLRTEAYVRAKFESLGWSVDERETSALRAASALPWYRNNALSLCPLPVHSSHV